MDKHRFKRRFAHILHAGEDHTRHPEEDDVISGDQRTSRIEIFQFLGLIGPAQRRERPKSRGEPGIQRIRVLLQVFAAAFWAGMGLFFGYNHLAAVLTIPSWYPVPPP